MRGAKKRTAPLAAQPRKSTHKARAIPFEIADRLHMDLMGIRAAAVTAILALGHDGLYGDVSLGLRRHVVQPVEESMKELEQAMGAS